MRKEPTASSTTCRSTCRELLVVSPNWIGDAVMATPFLLTLRRCNPDAVISVLCGDYVSEIFRRSSAVDRLVGVDRRRGLREVYAALRRNRPDDGWEICFILPRSFASALHGWLSGARRRIGYGGEMRSLLLTETLPGAGYRAEHLSTVFLRLLERADGQDSGEVPLPVVVPPYEWDGILTRLKLEGEYCVLAPGATYGSAKMWPVACFADLAARLARRSRWRIVLVGTAGERACAGQVIERAGVDGVNMAGRLTMAELLSVVRGARLVVGNDSGPVHLAAAMARPTVAIFGSTSPDWTAPRGDAVRVVSHRIQCSPCFKQECPDGDPRCLVEIGVDEVFDAAVALIPASSAVYKEHGG
ncbi:MAG: lipopolysaccharide heptosyltransferase II [bacterium]|nr:MAG: lipopolysaccharide heptosyltransferase II [bacterium]